MLAIRQLAAGIVTAQDLSLQEGGSVLLTGPSGSGKSLFFQALADLVPWQGDVQLDGRSCQSFAAHDWRRQVMWVPAEPVWWATTVADHFVSAPDLSSLDLSPDLFTRKPDLLSSGQRQRLALLRALDRNPRVLLLDEPTANLDADNTMRVETLLRRWCAAGNSLILASHDIAQQQRWAQCHWQVQDGRVEVMA